MSLANFKLKTTAAESRDFLPAARLSCLAICECVNQYVENGTSYVHSYY